MIKVIPYEPEHLLGITPLFKDKFSLTICNSMDYLTALKNLGVAYSGFDKDGNCVGAAGVKTINARTVEGWAILAENSKHHTKSIIRAVDLFIKSYFNHDVVGRFQATVKMDFPEGHRFAKLLGFTPEGILKNYDEGKDFMMYARINTWL